MKRPTEKALGSANDGIVTAISVDVRTGVYDELIARTVATAALRTLRQNLEAQLLYELPRYRRTEPVDAPD